MTRFIALALALTASPVFAASGPFFSLQNTNFIVLLGFLVFVGILIYFKVPAKVTDILDARAKMIKSELEEARALREEAKALLSTFERKQKEVKEQSERIVAAAKAQAEAAATQAKEDLAVSVARRLAAAEEQITAAETSAVRAVREQAISVVVSVAGEILAKQMTAEGASASIDAAIAQVGAKLH
jgi:F-type H+-transporting ATPase subunit b